MDNPDAEGDPTFISTDPSARCPECNSPNWLIIDEAISIRGLAPGARVGDYACNDCGHVWKPAPRG